MTEPGEREARRAALLRRFPFAEVWVTDGADEQASERFVDEQALGAYLEAMRIWRTWRAGSWLHRLVQREPRNPRMARTR